MAQQLRNLQIFRNGDLLTGSIAEVKELINGAFTGGKIVLNDGEPISIRYQEDESSEIKSLFGVAYVPKEGTPSILWNESGITIDTNPKESDYVTLKNDVDNSGNYTLTVAAKTISVNDATAADGETPAVDGLATALDVKNYVTEQIENINIPTVPEYTIQPLETATEGYLKSYQLFKGTNPVENAVIDIPKDYLVKSASIITVTEENKPQEDLIVGETYIDFVINTKDNDGSVEHLYINVTDLVDVYTQGNGISIDENNTISVKIAEDEQYITVDENGIYTTEALKTAIESAGETYTKGDDIDITDDNKINVSLSNAITPNTTVGFVNANTTIEAGSSLEDILRKILVKEVLATSVNPTNSLSLPSDVALKREVGTSLGTITLRPSYTDGYYKSSDTAVYTNAQFNTNNGTTNGKLNAGCEKGNVTYYKGTSEISDAVIETDGFQYVDNTKVTTNTIYSFKIETAYGASTINECKTSSGATQSISIQSGTTPPSSPVTVSFYHKTYVSSITGLVWDAANGYLVKDGVEYVPETTLKDTMSTSGEFLTTTEQYTNQTFEIPAQSSLCVIVPQGVEFSVYSTSDSSKLTDLFTNFKKYQTTNTLGVSYDIYISYNNGTASSYVTSLTYTSIK